MATRKKTQPAAEVTAEEVAGEKQAKPFDQFVDHQKQAIDSAGKALHSLIPDGVRDHGRKAVEEMLEGYRVLFNAALDEMLSTVRSTQENFNEMVDKVEDKVRVEKK
jgi:hypothetical protein